MRKWVRKPVGGVGIGEGSRGAGKAVVVAAGKPATATPASQGHGGAAEKQPAASATGQLASAPTMFKAKTAGGTTGTAPAAGAAVPSMSTAPPTSANTKTTGAWGPKAKSDTKIASSIATASGTSKPAPAPVPASKPTTTQVKEVLSQKETGITEAEIKRLSKRFQKLDADSSGSISLADFRSIPAFRSNPLVDRVVEIFDVDKNGEVDFREFILGMLQFTKRDNSEARLRFAFRIFDIDNDGYVSPGEMYQVLRLLCGSNLSQAHTQQLVDHTYIMCDTDGDGRISFKEFYAATRKTGIERRMLIDEYLL